MVSNRIQNFFVPKIKEVFSSLKEWGQKHPMMAVYVGVMTVMSGPGGLLGASIASAALYSGEQTKGMHSLFTKQGWSELSDDLKAVLADPKMILKSKSGTLAVAGAGAVAAGTLLTGGLGAPLMVGGITGLAYLMGREFNHEQPAAFRYKQDEPQETAPDAEADVPVETPKATTRSM